MLKNYPVKFNTEEIPEPVKWDEDFANVENVIQTEAGTDVVIVARYGKISVAAQFNCSSRWAAKFAAYRDEGEVTVESYDIKTGGYKQRKMRLRNFKSSVVENSYRTAGTNGLYAISFDLEEY